MEISSADEFSLLFGFSLANESTQAKKNIRSFRREYREFKIARFAV
jgi:hypothetical protein